MCSVSDAVSVLPSLSLGRAYTSTCTPLCTMSDAVGSPMCEKKTTSLVFTRLRFPSRTCVRRVTPLERAYARLPSHLNAPDLAAYYCLLAVEREGGTLLPWCDTQQILRAFWAWDVATFVTRSLPQLILCTQRHATQHSTTPHLERAPLLEMVSDAASTHSYETSSNSYTCSQRVPTTGCTYLRTTNNPYLNAPVRGNHGTS